MNRFNLDDRDSLVPYELLLKIFERWHLGVCECCWNVAAALKKLLGAGVSLCQMTSILVG